MPATAPSPPATGRGWLRRHLLPVAVLAVVLIARAAMLAMLKFDIGLDYYFHAMMGFQFLCLAAVLVLAVWFLALSGYPAWLKGAGVAVVLLAVVAGFATVRKMEFDGQMNPRLRFRWEPTDDELLARHLAASGPATGGAELTVGPADSPRYRGPNGDGTAPGVELAHDWPTPPRELWRHPVGGGHAGVAVAGNSAITLEQRGDSEVVVCYDRATGRERWAYPYPARFTQSEPMGGDGPRATPAVADGDVYSLGATGELVCLDGKTGRKRWQVNVLADNGAVAPEWGISASPVVHGKLVIVNPGVNPANNAGKAVAAYDRATGAKLWANGSKAAAYASPQVVALGGQEQVLVFDAAGLGGYDPTDGTELWRFPWKTDMGMNSAQPLVVGADRVLVSSEIGNGCAVVEVRKEGSAWSSSQVWKSRAMAARFCSPVVRDGRAYGLTGGRMVCVDLSTGKQLWADGDYGNGQLVLAGDLLVVTSEKGKVALVAADPAGHRELGEVQVFNARTWNVPALAGRQLFVRNHREMACLELP